MSVPSLPAILHPHAAKTLRGKYAANEQGQPVITLDQYGPGNPAPLRTPTSLLPLSTRASNVLKESGLLDLGKLVLKTQVEILYLPNAGRKVALEIQEVLESVGRSLGELPQQHE